MASEQSAVSAGEFAVSAGESAAAPAGEIVAPAGESAAPAGEIAASAGDQADPSAEEAADASPGESDAPAEEAADASAVPFAASGVFGIPITEATVIATGLYKEPITQKDVADYAMRMINAADKDKNAQQFVDNLKKRYGNGISAKCLIYNATGVTLEFITYKDWNGRVFEAPYPSQIQNGQWGAFLHVKAVAKGSAGAVVYRSRRPNSSSSFCDWLFCWRIPFTGANNVYTEIRGQGHFPQHWDYIFNQKLTKASLSSTDSNFGYRSKTEIAQGTTVNVRAIFELPN